MRFDSEFLKTLDQLRFASTRAFAGSGRGERRGRQRGRGIEFADYRPYAQGDDFRHIDWKVYKRLNRLLLRLFDEEQDLSVYLLLDTSASMAPHGKFDYAVRLTAALSYVGMAHLDRMLLLPWSDRLARETAGGHARPAMGRVLEAIESLAPGGSTNMWEAVSGFVRTPRRQGLAVVISDFLDPAGCERPLKLLASQGHAVVAVHVVASADRADVDLADEVALVDAETGERRQVVITPGLRRAYKQAWATFDEELASACARCRAEYVRADVAIPFEQMVLHTFRTGRFLE
jgi:uncharacterized protein (DUF58 family)